MDKIKARVAEWAMHAIESASLELGWDVDTQKIGTLQMMVWVRPVQGQPRRAFIVQIKEQM